MSAVDGRQWTGCRCTDCDCQNLAPIEPGYIEEDAVCDDCLIGDHMSEEDEE